MAGPINNAIALNGDDIGQTAFGYGTQATGSASFSAGEGTVASGKFSTVFGKTTTASGENSTSIGFTTAASDFASLVMGQYNSSGSSVTSDATSFSTSNTAFVIGNGSDDSNRSDAFKVMFNGNTIIGGDDLTIRNTFTNSRENHAIVGDITGVDITEEKITSFDANYIFRSSSVKARLTGYYTQMQDANEISFYFADGISGVAEECQE